MQKKELIRYILIGLLIIVLVFFGTSKYVEKQKQKTLEFDEKYSAICQSYNKSYLESGYSHYGRCYDIEKGVLTEYTIIQKGEEYYLKRSST